MIPTILPDLRQYKLMVLRFDSERFTTEQALAWVNGHGLAAVEAVDEFNSVMIAVSRRRTFHPTGFRPLYRGVRVELEICEGVTAIYGMKRRTGDEAPRP